MSIMALRDLSVVEGAVALAILGVLAWAVWTSRKTKRFRAGIFVERNGDTQEREREDQ